MLYEIAKEIAEELKAKGVPHPVIYGPERGTGSVAETRVVIERDRYGNDEIGSPTARPANPRMVGVRWLACMATIYAQSTIPGPGVQDHERVADQLVDKLTIALHKVIRVRKNQYRITRSKFLNAEELEVLQIENWPGVVYQIDFAIDRGVFDTTWAGEAKAERKLGGTGGVSMSTTLDADGEATTDAGDLPGASTR